LFVLVYGNYPFDSAKLSDSKYKLIQ